MTNRVLMKFLAKKKTSDRAGVPAGRHACEST